MNKNIVVEVDQDGFVVAVYCPDETYVVDLLDHADWNRDEGMSELDPAMDKYYRDVQNSTKDLKNCY
tara:strand:- start:232 stop:432 length:201 start_codon:yes stop_codon:yes gene_type:complete